MVYNLPTLIDARYKVKNMLSPGVVSDPKADKFDLHSYLFPLFEELDRLEEDVAAYDAHTDTYFSLQALPDYRRHSCDIEAISTIGPHRNLFLSSLQDLQHAIPPSIC
jgi:hypothetical protein